ncbi:MAG: D-aminoacyl-tRNA deacylase [Prevotella sp.]|nr:D-aminoacyl-tRNA deacylase [Bacteroides sp.]MCM1366270.1 D-aminoacyl-tRNA deacylase [Prevotella sp.]MCM1436326.1 D-aminoacyl-tRNA deacylase [Prevotella sp.]
MIAVVQRVSEASVVISGKRISEIGKGMLILVCVVPDDTDEDMNLLIKKVSKLRIFDDEDGVMNLSVTDIGGDILCVSQFTLAASVRKGNRPSYIGAARPEMAEPFYEKFCSNIAQVTGRDVKRGVFGADMKVSLINDGPVTIIIDTKRLI